MPFPDRRRPRGVTLIEAVMALFLLSTLIAAFLMWIKPFGMMDATLETQAVAVAQETLERYTNDPDAVLQLVRSGEEEVDVDAPSLNAPQARVTVRLEKDVPSGLDSVTVRVSYQAPWGAENVRLATLVPPLLRTPADAAP